MLKTDLIHPDILAALASAGHHSKVLIADGNYPVATKLGPNAEIVHLNFMPGLLSCNQVLAGLLTAIAVEEINTMQYVTEGEYGLTEDPPVWNDYRETIKAAGLDMDLKPIEKWAFYDEVMSDDHVLTIQTGEKMGWANLILTLGCRTF
ncbi:MAG: RbsD/FucU family protein [Phycisphaeraceae bacterium]